MILTPRLHLTIRALGLVFFLIPSLALAKLEYSANQLLMKDSEQMTALILKKIKNASDLQAKLGDSDDSPETDAQSIAELQDAMRIALSRPDQDGLRGILFARVHRELNDLDANDKVLTNLIHEAILALKSKRQDDTSQATYIILLENLMAEIRPEMDTHKSYKSMIESIRDAKIKITSEMKSKEMLTLMQDPVSPSVTADKILSPKSRK
jgi:hypothetical protein